MTEVLFTFEKDMGSEALYLKYFHELATAGFQNSSHVRDRMMNDPAVREHISTMVLLSEGSENREWMKANFRVVEKRLAAMDRLEQEQRQLREREASAQASARNRIPNYGMF